MLKSHERRNRLLRACGIPCPPSLSLWGRGGFRKAFSRSLDSSEGFWETELSPFLWAKDRVKSPICHSERSEESTFWIRFFTSFRMTSPFPRFLHSLFGPQRKGKKRLFISYHEVPFLKNVMNTMIATAMMATRMAFLCSLVIDVLRYGK